MDLFLNEVFSFPTIIFTIPLIILTLLWLMAFAGLLDLDILDFGTDSDAGGDAEAGSAGTSWLEKLGLNGVPLTVSLTLIDIYAFSFTYLARKYAAPLFDGVLTATAQGAVVAAFAIVIALPLSALCIRPLRRFFITHEGVAKNELIGTICTLTTLSVSETFGQAVTPDGMVLSVRASSPNTIGKGNKIVLIDYLVAQDCYSVVTESELMAMSSSS
ncbi:OB-fold-containig protein [Paraglaciecola hydrolytica]|uniref:DUF1449 domain-containing protein n=1 Tax=Paraglaciecola hydrolytica TaxID=1799789 RepID=A0A135ZZE8_9ALTE|nr:OB-fold-containig protein [Paraglaciecola hydrolytica]KXI28260.1 hypothetical protein AX660_17950 [Paraglaciecola hydrolytica]